MSSLWVSFTASKISLKIVQEIIDDIITIDQYSSIGKYKLEIKEFVL